MSNAEMDAESRRRKALRTDDGIGGVVGVEVNTWREESESGVQEREAERKDSPQTYMGASAEGALMTTFFAPPFKCAPAAALVVKTPVDSTT